MFFFWFAKIFFVPPRETGDGTKEVCEYRYCIRRQCTYPNSESAGLTRAKLNSVVVPFSGVFLELKLYLGCLSCVARSSILWTAAE